MNRIVLATALLLTTVGAASARDYGYVRCDTAEIDARRAHEMNRIEQGRRSGQLSWREYNALKAEQARIAEHERMARRDGCVTPDERARLNRELDRASQDIRNLKHNDETSGYGYRRWSRWW